MFREISLKFLQWKENPDRKPLILVGARQVGKTYSVRFFAKEHYKKMLEINFQDDVRSRQFFAESRSIQDILTYLEVNYSDTELNQDTLIFFDEIQLCPELITSLKFFSEKCSSDVICSGSMLGIRIGSMSSFPVGYVEMMTLYPMSFQEFLKAGKFSEKHLLKAQAAVEQRESVPEPVHEKLNSLFTEYLVCGGMPEAVREYQTGGLSAAIKVNRRLMRDYEMDIAHYADVRTRVKAVECFQSLPLQLAKDNKKFQYKLVREGYNARHFEESLSWLSNAGLIYRIYRLKQIGQPLEMNKEMAVFKAYLFDTGLLVSQFSDTIISKVLEDTLGVYKGVLYENIMAQMLFARSRAPYYYEPNTSSEIDFVIEFQGMPTPIEVKGGLHTKSTSFTNFVRNHHCKTAFRFSKKNVGVSEDGVTSYLPYYAMEWIL